MVPTTLSAHRFDNDFLSEWPGISFSERRFLARGKRPLGHFLTETSPDLTFLQANKRSILWRRDFIRRDSAVWKSHGSASVTRNGHFSRESSESLASQIARTELPVTASHGRGTSTSWYAYNIPGLICFEPKIRFLVHPNLHAKLLLIQVPHV